MSDTSYAFEDIRKFVLARPFLMGSGRPPHLTCLEYEGLKGRTLQLAPERAAYLRTFAEGWKEAKG